MRHSPILFAVLASLSLAGSTRLAPADAITNAADALRDGWYQDQAFLSPQVVQNAAFGQRYSVAVTGQVYAQPLVTRGTVFIATEDNWIYSVDADTGRVRWSRQLATPWNASDLGCGQISPHVGITGTPVVDDATGTAYLVVMSYASGATGPAVFWMHALDATSGTERRGWPVQLQGAAQNSTGQTFIATRHAQRPGLLLLDGVVYAAFGSHCDIAPYQGWVFGVTTGGQTKARWTTLTSVGSSGAAVWQSGGGIVSDGSGRIMLTTANGGAPSTPAPGSSPPANLGESVVRLSVQADGSLVARDFFAPSNAPSLDIGDADVGSYGPIGLPGPYFGSTSIPHLAVAGGKDGWLYLLNRDNLGGFRQGSGSTDNVVGRYGQYAGLYGRAAAWPGDGGYVYALPSNDYLRCFKYGTNASGTPTLSEVAVSPQSYGSGSGSPIVTSNGTASGSALVWTISADGRLHAFDALPQGSALVERYTATVGPTTKFLPPGAGRNMIFAGTSGRVVAFGAPAVALTATKNKTAASVHLQWSGGIAPFTLRRATNAAFTANVQTLVDHQSVTTYDDYALNDGVTYFYLVN